MNDQKIEAILQGGSVACLTVAAVFAGLTLVNEGAVDWELVWIAFFITALPWAMYVYLGGAGYVD